MNLLSKYINRTDFKDYADFKENVSLIDIESFNFGFDIVDEYARLDPTKRALVWCDNNGKELILTFHELSKLSNQTANMLLSKGICKGDFVMTMLNRRYEYYIVAVALCKIGAVLIPATCLLTHKDIEYRCINADVKAIIATDESPVIDAILEAQPQLPELRFLFTISDVCGFLNFHTEIKAHSCTLRVIDKPNLDDKMLVYFTSGTTGYPKMVTHSFKYPLGHIMTAYFWQAVQDDGLHFTMAETGWAKFSWGKIYGQWIAGTAVFCYDYYGRFTPTDVLPLLAKYRITTFCAPPTIYRFLIREDLSKYDFSSLTHCTTAGEPLNAEVFRIFKQMTGISICEGFGQSESAVILATFRYCKPHPGSIGLPTPIYDVRLLDDDIDVTDTGKEGEIVINLRENQFGLLIGYHKDAEKTRFAVETGCYHTGDLAYKDKNGYFWFVGRKDDIIKSSGYRIGPFEVESALQEHPAVLECAITGAPDPLRGQIVKATIVLAKGYQASEELKKELQEHVKKTTAPYKYPRIIDFVLALPKTVSGKIKRKDIRKEFDTEG
ncbi:MAG: AMP-binding protein [Christensenellaceae bacterium]|jgi:acetyl-CoA synthetase|nr:AMP-binding protein [Christensenellaceae bacterium]